jgi:ubiquinone/menaquinone biosynthesis C-methylase UbiE
MSGKEHVCGFEHAKWLDNGFRRMFQNPEKMFKPYITPGSTILDIGCGPGTFTQGLATLNGQSGKVIAIDLQDKMIELTRAKMSLSGMLDRVTFHRCSKISIDIDISADFILTFYMVHETPDPLKFIDQISSLLARDGYYYLAEPKGHVSKGQYEKMLTRCKDNGLLLIKRSGIISRIAVFQKPR